MPSAAATVLKTGSLKKARPEDSSTPMKAREAPEGTTEDEDYEGDDGEDEDDDAGTDDGTGGQDLLNETTVKSGYLWKRGEKRKVSCIHF